MKQLILFILIASTLQTFSQVRVSGYYRKNGTYVQPHYRSNPDGNPYNNWSYPGNVNPYTGKVATGNPSTYLNNYYNKNTSSSSSYNNYTPNATTNYTYYVTQNNVDVRSGPSTNNSVITTLNFRDIVGIVETRTDYPYDLYFLKY